MGVQFLIVLLLIALGFIVYRYVVASSRLKSDRAVRSALPPQPVTFSPPATSDLSMLPKEFIVLDLETTGLDPERNEIIEVGARRVNLESDTHLTFQTLVRPKKRVPRKITTITGISQRMVDQDGIPLVDALSQFAEFIQDLPLVTFKRRL